MECWRESVHRDEYAVRGRRFLRRAHRKESRAPHPMSLRSGQAAATVGFDLCPQRVFYLGATLIGVSPKEQVFPLVAPCVCHCGVQKAEVPEGHTGSVKPEHCPCQILWSIEGSTEGPIPFRPPRP